MQIKGASAKHLVHEESKPDSSGKSVRSVLSETGGLVGKFVFFVLVMMWPFRIKNMEMHILKAD